jgi:hypothetical protein
MQGLVLVDKQYHLYFVFTSLLILTSPSYIYRHLSTLKPLIKRKHTLRCRAMSD